MSNIIKHEKKPFEIAVESASDKFIELCGDPKLFIREAGFALQAIRGNTALQKIATNPIGQESIKNAITNVALIGISLNPALQLASLIPRKGRCCLDIQYRGLIKIATEENTNISFIEALVVYTWDKFKYKEGSEPYIDHEPNMLPDCDNVDEILKSPTRIWDYIVCAYSRAIFRDGKVSIVALPKWKLWKTFQTSQAKDDQYSPWQKWPEEQIRKTVIKYHTKTLQGANAERLQKAVAILNEHEGLDREAQVYDNSNAHELNERIKNSYEHISEDKTHNTIEVRNNDDQNKLDNTQNKNDNIDSKNTYNTSDNKNDTPDVEEVLRKSLEAANNLKTLENVWNMVLSKGEQLSPEATRRLNETKNNMKKKLSDKESKTENDNEGYNEKCRTCKRIDMCMNKNISSGVKECEGPFLA